MFHTLFCIFASMSIGYGIWYAVYWHDNHCMVQWNFGVLDVPTLFKILAVVGFVLSFF